jgi:magnesium-transporting ATPase (P-type)
MAWKDVRVGSIVKVLSRAEVPADLVVLATSSDKHICYIETSNIDGETNLKQKEAVPGAAALSDALRADLSRTAALTGEAAYELPNDRIHTFFGTLTTSALGGGAASGALGADAPLPTAVTLPIDARSMLLRGCQVRNTEWVLGLVVYTGLETKVFKKSGGARSKMSAVEATMNTLIKVVFAAQAVLCTVTTIAAACWSYFRGQYELSYLGSAFSDMLIPVWLGDWFSFLLLFNNFIPISLYITVEMVNYAQGRGQQGLTTNYANIMGMTTALSGPEGVIRGSAARRRHGSGAGPVRARSSPGW